jgi:hypothetical protein
MTGEQLLKELITMTPEQRRLQIVSMGNDKWFYDSTEVKLIHVKHSHGREDEYEEPNFIAII